MVRAPFYFSSTMNETMNYPVYFSPKPSLVDGVSDIYLTLAAPVVAYWSLSLLFHWFDISGWKWLEKYRIHESAEAQSRNLVTMAQVIWGVLFQQFMQTTLGLLWISHEQRSINHVADLRKMALFIHPFVSRIVEGKWAPIVIEKLSYYTYWWIIPCVQLLFAMFIIDTWQYFLHRLMHVNKYLYRACHSWHHRLYVPYAFGSQYSHPVEGFLLDALGAVIAESLSGMSTRQAMFLFTVSTFKTVDDHCGYKLPFDPLQLVTGNNADYHDIHHQTIGLKYNFSQPWFVHWDTVLGTRMTRADIVQRRTAEAKMK